MTVSTYLFFNGNCEEAFKFYASVTGGAIEMTMRYGDSPSDAPADWNDKILHTSLRIGDSVLLGSDGHPSHPETMGGFAVSLDVKTAGEAEKVFKALSQGGTVTMPMEETFFAERFGMLKDRFGTPWMIGCSKPM